MLRIAISQRGGSAASMLSDFQHATPNWDIHLPGLTCMFAHHSPQKLCAKRIKKEWPLFSFAAIPELLTPNS